VRVFTPVRTRARTRHGVRHEKSKENMWSKNPSGNALQEYPTLQKRTMQKSWRLIHRAANRGRESKGACEPKEKAKYAERE